MVATTQQKKGSTPPYLVAIINIEAGRNSCCQEVAPIWSPLTFYCNIVPADQAMLSTWLQDDQRQELTFLKQCARN